MALLLLRAALGFAVILQGIICVPGPEGTFGAWVECALALTGGSLLVLGLLTPIAAAGIGLGAIGIASRLLQSCTPLLFDSGLSIALGGAILVAIAMLGPGAISIDARMFGRREIIIPPLAQ